MSPMVTVDSKTMAQTSSQHKELRRLQANSHPIPSILENITSSLPSFGVPSSSKPPTPPLSLTTTSSSSSYPSSSSSSKRPWRSYLPSDPALSGALFGSVGIVLTLGGVWGYRRFGRRIRNSDYVTSGLLERRRWVKGVVTSVGDGDNFRLFHTPLFYSYPFKFRSIPRTPKETETPASHSSFTTPQPKQNGDVSALTGPELKNETLHIRISGVDAPEAAHFGNPAQPHSAESLEWLRQTVLGRRMRVQLLRKDQYNRIVGVPYIRRWVLPDRPLPIMMLKEGMAVVYTSGGGEYGPWGLDGMKAIEAEARKAKKGLWALKNFEHPAEYKKRVKAGEEAMIGVEEVTSGERTGIWGLIKRLLGR